jgi:endonuclease-3
MAETQSELKKRARTIIRLLKKEYPEAACSLDYDSAHQLLVATILSAQCTDEQVNKVTPPLFRKYRSLKSFAVADTTELEKMIKSTGFFRNKAKSIKQSSVAILEEYGGRVPDKLDELVKLPGVGRKTASVVLGAWFDKAEGVVVDTHVKRIAYRLGLTDKKDPHKVELDLMEILPRKEWILFTHLIIAHGRKTCVARRPKCEVCVLARHCPSAGLWSDGKS